MEHNGWIKLHRKLLNKGFYKNSQYVHLWVHLLLLANHTEHEYMHDGTLIMVKEGQLITGRDKLVDATGIPGTTIERILKMLENEHQIGQQKTNKYRVITILNWKEHQNRTPERTSNGQQADTYKNDKNEENTSALEDEPRKSYSSDSEEERPKRKRKVTNEMEEVFALFSDNPARFQWPLFENQRVAAEVLHREFGIDTLKNRYSVALKYRGEELCPFISNPSQFLEKMPNMERFLKTMQS